ncbi:MerR family transcriptional regulator [Actinomadura monticuli]|uniref:MerR family transcriptional regulator n=1 Tax=Actinomadura monticuli TaxID=3097367 RepID=A0ABV4QGX6_9ACTN
MDSTWTIGELAERAADALTADGAAQVSGRVRDLPNTRLIRWYTTIGLVDPPLGRRGRTALYGHRHLLQLVAVKRRQAEGRSIAEIQLELAAAPDETLARIAALPAAPSPQPSPAPTSPGSAPSTDQATNTPAPARRGTSADVAGGGAPPSDAPSGAPAGPAVGGAGRRKDFWSARPDVSYDRANVSVDYGRPLPPVVQGVRLAPGVTLLLDGPTLSGGDLAALDAAARPLLDELRRRGLLTTADSPALPPEAHSRRSP